MDFFLTTDIVSANILAARTDGRYSVANAEETGVLGLAQARLRAVGSDHAAARIPAPA